MPIQQHTHTFSLPTVPDWKDEGWQLGITYTEGAALLNNGTSYQVKIGQEHTATADNEPGVGANWQTFWRIIASRGAVGDVTAEALAAKDAAEEQAALAEAARLGAVSEEVAARAAAELALYRAQQAGPVGSALLEYDGYAELLAGIAASDGLTFANAESGAAMRVTADGTSVNPYVEFTIPNLLGADARFLEIEYTHVSGPTERRIYYTGSAGGTSAARYIANSIWNRDGRIIIDMWNLTAGADAWKNDTNLTKVRLDVFNGTSGEYLIRRVALIGTVRYSEFAFKERSAGNAIAAKGNGVGTVFSMAGLDYRVTAPGDAYGNALTDLGVADIAAHGRVTPQHYGAVGDNVTDDTNAFQRAFANRQLVTVPEPPVAYNLSGATVVMAEGSIFWGEGQPIINGDASAVGTVGVNVFELQSWCQFHNARINVTVSAFQPSPDGTYQAGLSIGNARIGVGNTDTLKAHIHVSNVHVHGEGPLNMHGLHAYGWVEQCLFEKVHVTGQTNFAIVAHAGSDIDSTGITGDTTKSWHPSYLTFRSCSVETTLANSNAFRLSGCSYCLFDRCEARSPEGFEIFAYDIGGIYAQNVAREEVNAGHIYKDCRVKTTNGNYGFQGSANSNDGQAVPGPEIFYGNDKGHRAGVTCINCTVQYDLSQDSTYDPFVFSYLDRVALIDCLVVAGPTTGTNYALRVSSCNVFSAYRCSFFGPNGIRVNDVKVGSIDLCTIRNEYQNETANTYGVSVVAETFSATLSQPLAVGDTTLWLTSIPSGIGPSGQIFYDGELIQMDGAATLEDNQRGEVPVPIKPSRIAIASGESVTFLAQVECLNIRNTTIEGYRFSIDGTGTTEAPIRWLSLTNVSVLGGAIYDVNVSNIEFLSVQGFRASHAGRNVGSLDTRAFNIGDNVRASMKDIYLAESCAYRWGAYLSAKSTGHIDGLTALGMQDTNAAIFNPARNTVWKPWQINAVRTDGWLPVISPTNTYQAVHYGQTNVFSGTSTGAKLTLQKGDRIERREPPAGGFIGWVATEAGTLGTLSGLTADTTSGDAVITVNTPDVLAVGDYLTVAGTTGNRVKRVNGTTVTLTAAATSTGTAVAVSYTAPVLKTYGSVSA